jgi:hypothetical protein
MTHLLERLQRRSPEDNFIERKATAPNDHVLRQTLVAFANSVPENQTAVLFIGIDDKTGAVLGISDPDKLQRRVGDAGEDCYPAIRPSMVVLSLEEKWVLAVEVGYSPNKPHFAGPAFVRSGSRSVKASEGLYRDLLTSHCSPAGELLKCKGTHVTVRVINKKLGNRYPEWDPSVNREYECTVVRCDPFSVTFDLHGYGESCTESLDGIKLDWDSLKQRRMVVVRGTPPIA